MSLSLKILIRVVKRRISSGEILADVFADYPKLTADEVKIVENEISLDAE